MRMSIPSRRPGAGSIVAAAVAAFVAGFGAPGPAMAETIRVTDNGDTADGATLRAALAAAAKSDEATEIVIDVDDEIEINSTLTYDGNAPLTIRGEDANVFTQRNITMLAVTAGADLTVEGVMFSVLNQLGEFSIENRGDADGDGGKGIFVDVRDDQEGVVTLTLIGVSVMGTSNHGIHVSDCDLADDCGGGGGGAGGGSAASIEVILDRVFVIAAGRGEFDADGVRVDERGPGSIHFTANESSFTAVGADGVELDEGQDGDVIAIVTASEFSENGSYCDPAILEAFLPDAPEGAFEDGEMAEADIPGPVTGSPDDSCIEREVELYASGSVEEYEFGIDLDDGIDIDEAGPGSLRAIMVSSSISSNLDEGIDFDEEDEGDIEVTFIGTRAWRNTDDGFKNSESGPGGVTATMIGSSATDNGGKGAVFEEEDAGDVRVTVINSETSGNDDGDDTGLELVQEDDGTGTAAVQASSIADGIDAEGVSVTSD